jgi:asparagine synthase (glutamine-hydrolysing)
MCGIYGEVALRPGVTVGRFAEEATNALHHRGPDQGAIWNGGDVCLGIRRLRIIDLEGGEQPIWNEDRTMCIVYNGELYNFQDLRPQLESLGHRFRSRSDTEVVLHAYEEWGPECLTRFIGMFAIAIWDTRNRSLFLARDRIGEKPLYYFTDGDRLVFASETKAILADPSIPRKLHLPGLANYLAFGHAVAPDTIYSGIRKLLPGHYAIVSDGRIRTVEYWDVPSAPPEADGRSDDDYGEEIVSLLDDSVRRRMVADVPVGAFLSGGVDSSAVVALMTRHATERVKTFSLGFTAGGAYDELPEARRVAVALGTDHVEIRPSSVDLVELLRTLVYQYDEPFGDAASFPLYLLSRAAREQVTVVLTGDGGDELFGGYRRYAAEQAASLYHRLPQRLASDWIPAAVQKLPRLRRLKRLAYAMPERDAARRYARWLEVFGPDMRAELLEPALLERLGGHDPAGVYPRYYHARNGASSNDHLNRLMYVDVKTWLADAYMEKTDKATMACSIEARLPLLDHRLVELAFRIPSSAKVRGRSLKRILKHAVRDLVPREVLHRPKHGFAVPTDPWLRSELQPFAREILLDDRARSRGYFDPKVVERLLSEHVSGRHVWEGQLWLLLNFELWHRTYLDRSGV